MENSMEKQFFKFIIPSMLTMLLNGLYTVVDGFFIGHSVGDVGLAGIGLVWPITAVLIALGMGIGVGGSVLMSTYRGAGDDKNANEARANLFFLLVIAGIFTTVFFTLFHTTFVKALGAKGEIYDAAVSYIRIIAFGGSMQIVASGLLPLIRNNHQTIEAMFIMCSGLICNILLDFCFTMVIPMGLAGAALATILSQALTVFGCILCLCRQKENKVKRSELKWNFLMVKKIIKIGISPFGLSLMPSLVTVFNNLQCLAYGGDFAVAAYSVMNYFLASVLMLLEGIGEGLQPLFSYFNGAKKYQTMKKIRNKGLLAIICFSFLFLLLCIPARTFLPVIFNTSYETTKMMQDALPILCIGFPLIGVGKLFISYFYACGESLFSVLLVYLDPVLFTPLCIFTLPHIFGLKGVWMSSVSAQILIMITLTICFIMHTIKLKNKEMDYAGGNKTTAGGIL